MIDVGIQISFIYEWYIVTSCYWIHFIRSIKTALPFSTVHGSFYYYTSFIRTSSLNKSLSVGSCLLKIFLSEFHFAYVILFEYQQLWDSSEIWLIFEKRITIMNVLLYGKSEKRWNQFYIWKCVVIYFISNYLIRQTLFSLANNC